MPKRIDSFHGEYRWLSNFAPVMIWLEGFIYPTVEHAYQASKSASAKEKDQIAHLETPGQAKRAGKAIRCPDPAWDEAKKLKVMEACLREKFSQAPYQDLLLATDDAELVEGNSWNDTFWGVCAGKGHNHLGKLLMKIRGDIKMAKPTKDNEIINVIDLEATCWDTDHGEKIPNGQYSEIIEVGIVELCTKTLTIMNRVSYLVRPEQSTVGTFCTSLTGHTQDVLDAQGLPFETVMVLLKRTHQSRNRLFASWGDYDRKMFEGSFRRRRQNMSPSMADEVSDFHNHFDRHLNICTLFTVANALDKEPSVAEALKLLGRKFEGVPHRGLDDAMNIAVILKELLSGARFKPSGYRG